MWSLKSRPRSAELQKAIDASLDDTNRALLQAGFLDGFEQFGREISMDFLGGFKISLRSLCKIRLPICVNLCRPGLFPGQVNIYVCNCLHIFGLYE